MRYNPPCIGSPTTQPKTPRRVASCQLHRLVAICQQVATSLSISSSCNKSVKIRLVATCHLQNCYNLLNFIKLQQACWQLATDLMFLQAVASHANASLYRLVETTCYKMSTDLLQFRRFWLRNLKDGSIFIMSSLLFSGSYFNSKKWSYKKRYRITPFLELK